MLARTGEHDDPAARVDGEGVPDLAEFAVHHGVGGVAEVRRFIVTMRTGPSAVTVIVVNRLSQSDVSDSALC